MKTKLLLLFLVIIVSGLYAQKAKATVKWRSSEMDTLTVAQTMFDDQNFVMAFPYLNELQKNHPEETFLKYLTGICCLFKEDTQKQGLELLLEVYEKNKRAEDIEYYLALAYHYNNNFEEAIVMTDKYLSKKHLSKPQIRVTEKLKETCKEGQKLPVPADEGTLDDYIKMGDEGEE